MPWGGDNHAPDHKGWSLVKSTPAPDPSKDDTGGADLRGDAEGAQAPQGSQVVVVVLATKRLKLAYQKKGICPIKQRTKKTKQGSRLAMGL